MLPIDLLDIILDYKVRMEVYDKKKSSIMNCGCSSFVG